MFFCQKLKKVAGRQFSEAKKTSCQTKKPAGSQKNGLPKLASRRVGAKKTSWQIENKASRKLRVVVVVVVVVVLGVVVVVEEEVIVVVVVVVVVV